MKLAIPTQLVALGRRLTKPKRAAVPIDNFDEAWYLATYPDIERAIKAGGLRSGLDHYIEIGFYEGRLGSPAQSLDGAAAIDQFGSSEMIVYDAEPGVDWVASAGNVLVAVGHCNAPVTGLTAVSAQNERSRLETFTTHRLSKGPSPFGFIAVIEADQTRTPPAFLLLDAGPALEDDSDLQQAACIQLAIPSRMTDFSDACSELCPEALLDLYLISDRLHLPAQHSTELIRLVIAALLQSNQAYTEKPLFAASLDNAWISQASDSYYFSGWMLEAKPNEQVDVRIVALVRGDVIPLRPLTKFSPRPDLEGLSARYVIPSKPGFIGYGTLPRGGGGVIKLIAKDSAHQISIASRLISRIDEKVLYKNVLNDLVRTFASAHGGRPLALFKELFPYQITVPRRPLEFAEPSNEQRTCHLFLDLRSGSNELQSIMDEIVQGRFQRVIVTCMLDRVDATLSTTLRAFEMSNPDLQMKTSIVGYDSKFLKLDQNAHPGDIVIFGRPLDVLQFEISDNAISRTLRNLGDGSVRCYGYIHHEFSAMRDRGDKIDGQALLASLKERLFDDTTGFAAFMPAAYFSLLNPDRTSLSIMSNEIKTLLLALELVGLAEFRAFNGTVFYGSARAADAPPGVEEAILANIDYVRTASSVEGSDRSS